MTTPHHEPGEPGEPGRPGEELLPPIDPDEVEQDMPGVDPDWPQTPRPT